MDGSGIGEDRGSEGVGFLIGEVAGVFSWWMLNIVGPEMVGCVVAIFRMIGFRRSSQRWLRFFVQGSSGRSIGLIGLDFLKKMFDVFVFVFEEVHLGQE